MRCLNCGQKGIPLSVEICPRCRVHLPSLMRDVLPHGTLLRSGTYRIEYALGRGGFGITYQATHTALEQLVAIKEFYPQEHAIRESTTGVLIIPTTKQEVYKHGIGRFLREGKILAKLNHPNIVQVRDFFEERGTAYLVMELITGSTLREELNAQPEKRLAPARVETLMDALVNAVTAEHGINASVDKQDWQLNHVQLATGILLAEAQVINWTAGAWNHHIIGMGTWDGLSKCHFSKDWWDGDEPLHLRFYPVLIMPYYRAVPFASLPNSLKRKLFPKMLPALWNALCEVHHGDLSESNILISQNYDKFYIIDPGILLTSPVSGDRYTTKICVFTTTPANYPILPPFWDLQLEGGTFNSYGLVEYIKQLSNQVLSDWNLLFTQSSRIPDNSLSRLQPKNRPSLPDLLAIGIIYYRILTNQEIFLGRSILPEKPAWQYSFGFGSRELNETYNQLADSLSQKYIEKELNKFNITQAEKLLVSALLNLEINHKEHLRSFNC